MQRKTNHLFHASLLVAAVAIGAPALLATSAAQAEAARATAPIAGAYRTMVGEVQVTALSDGVAPQPLEQIIIASPADVKKALAKARLPNPTPTSVNALVVHAGNKLVLVDTGAGIGQMPGMGGAAAALKVAGYSPEQVDEVWLTHMHSDHLGGLMQGGAMVFPNAVVRMDQRDADYWLSPANAKAAPAASKGLFEAAQAAIAPYQSAGRVKPFTAPAELLPGIRALPAHGHTEGHTVYLIESQGQKLALLGDLVNEIQLTLPQVATHFDTDGKEAVSSRNKLFSTAAREGWRVAVAHLPFPGLGRLYGEGKGYRFVADGYNPAK